MIEQIISHLLGFLIGGALFTIVSMFTLKFFIRRILKELTSTKQKSRFGLWLQEIIKDSLVKSLDDPKIKKITIEVLELVKEKLEAKNE